MHTRKTRYFRQCWTMVRWRSQACDLVRLSKRGCTEMELDWSAALCRHLMVIQETQNENTLTISVASSLLSPSLPPSLPLFHSVLIVQMAPLSKRLNCMYIVWVTLAGKGTNTLRTHTRVMGSNGSNGYINSSTNTQLWYLVNSPESFFLVVAN